MSSTAQNIGIKYAVAALQSLHQVSGDRYWLSPKSTAQGVLELLLAIFDNYDIYTPLQTEIAEAITNNDPLFRGSPLDEILSHYSSSTDCCSGK